MLENRNFLVPDATFAIEMIAFLTVLVVMTRYVIPTIRDRMNERQRSIDQALAGAREADRRRRDAEAAADSIRAEARREARQIIEQGHSMHDHLIAEGRHTGLEEYRWLAGRADRDLQRRTELARQQLRRQARAAAIAAVRVVGSEADAERVAALVDEHLDALDPAPPAAVTETELPTSRSRLTDSSSQPGSCGCSSRTTAPARERTPAMPPLSLTLAGTEQQSARRATG
jgi:F-type H+-transporting ATPase subunit b